MNSIIQRSKTSMLEDIRQDNNEDKFNDSFKEDDSMKDEDD